MRKDFVDFICELHGYLIRTKEIHWNTNSNAEHVLCDDFHKDLLVLEDEFAECCMGIEGNHFKIGDLLPMVPNAESFTQMLKAFEMDVLKMKKKVTADNFGGIMSILDDMLACVNKYRYRSTQK